MIRFWSILVVTVVALNAVVGVGRRELTFCSGGDDPVATHADTHRHHHDHDHHDCSGEHEHSASEHVGHESCAPDGWHLHLAQHADCCCDDVVVPVFGLIVLLQVESGSSDVLASPSAIANVPPAHLVASVSRDPVHTLGALLLFDPGGDRALATVRSTRINV